MTDFEKLPFKEMVDEVAHAAAMELIKGTAWRSIFYTAAVSVCVWKDAQKK